MVKKCITPYCKNKANHGKRCNTCCDKRKRKNNPMRYAYDTLKMNCKRRKKIFKLTFEQFKFYAQATDYIAGKGRKSLSYSIDCRDPALGYTESNIRPMHKGDNSAKGKKRLVYDWETWHATVEKVGAIRNIDDPF